MKNLNSALVAGAALLLVPSVATGQPVLSAETGSTVVLKEGVEIPLVTITELSSKRAKVGQRFDLEVADDVTLNGQVVIAQGARAVGEVTRVKKKGMWGKSGKLETRLLYVKVGDQNVRITGAVGDKGKAGTAGVVGAVLVAPVVGFFVTGTSAVVPPRTPATAYLDADLPVRFASAPVEAVVIRTAAPAAPASDDPASAKVQAATQPAAAASPQ